jgi:hypothetical protein
MTMFSMKPKFDLAAFLAVPADPGTFRRRDSRKFTRASVPDEDTDTEEPVARKAAPPS